MTDEHARWNELDIRRPDDVRTSPGGPVPIGWQAEKRTEHADRLSNLALPADFPYEVERGDAGDALTVLALGESIRRDLDYERGGRILTALRLGATWSQVAAALDVPAKHARTLLESYADGQRSLRLRYKAEGSKLGLGAAEYAAALALVELGDDERVNGCTDDCDGADMCTGTTHRRRG